MGRFIRLVNRIAKCRRAVAAVEFALIFPVFVALLFGIIIYGSYFAVVHSVQQLAAEAARSSIGGLSDSERSTLAQNYVTANASSYPLIAAKHLTVDAAPSPRDANIFVVTVDYDASGMFFNLLPHFVPAPPPNIVRTAVIPRGGY